MRPDPAVLAVIPARGGSKGLPGKNIRLLAGVPLIAHTIRCALASPVVTTTVVSTDDPAIADVARRFGADVPFMRPAELATDTAPMWPVMKHALQETERLRGARYDFLLLLDPTSPGRTHADIGEALRLASLRDTDGVVAVSEPDFNPIWTGVIEHDGYMTDLFPEARGFGRRQDVPTVYRINAALYLWSRGFVLQASDWRAGRLRLLVIPEERAIHIDTPEQFRRLEVLAHAGLVELPEGHA